MFSKLFQKQIYEELKRAYDAGLAKGYELGYMMGKAERTNRGFIIGSKVEREIAEIIEKEKQ